MICAQSLLSRLLPAFLLFTAASVRADEVDDYLRQQMERRHLPGLSLAVVRNGQVVKMQGYGQASQDPPAPARPESVYQIGSVTKQFTAAAMMLLVEDGKLKLDEKLRTYFPDFPEAWSAVTVRHLLTHTSGIPSYTSLPEYGKSQEQDISHADQIRRVVSQPLDFPPGEKWSYSNTGYYLLGMLIEKLSGKPYGEFLQDRIFTPLGMKDTRFNDYRLTLPNRATGYVWEGSYRKAERTSPTQSYAAGALVSTVIDLVKWNAALEAGKLLKKASWEQSWTEARLNNGKTTGYGFGWGLGPLNGHRMVAHGGGIPGFTCHLARFPDDHLTVIILTNGMTDVGVLAQEVAAKYVPALKPAVARAIEDKDPQTTEKHKAVIAATIAGTLDPNLFTEAARKALFPDRVKEAEQFLKSLGPLQKFELLERREENGTRVDRYRAVFEKQTLLFTFARNAEGKLGGLAVMPE